jgi:hypothetical protein
MRLCNVGGLPRYAGQQIRSGVASAQWFWFSIALSAIGVLAMLGGIGALLWVYFIGLAGFKDAGYERMTGAVAGVTALLILLIPWQFWMRRRLARKIVRRCVSAGTCAACGYPLADTAADDGCRVCSECGAGWRPEL